MTTFAILFMTVSMLSVTSLAAYCIYRVLKAPPPVHDPEDD